MYIIHTTHCLPHKIQSYGIANYNCRLLHLEGETTEHIASTVDFTGKRSTASLSIDDGQQSELLLYIELAFSDRDSMRGIAQGLVQTSGHLSQREGEKLNHHRSPLLKSNV